MATPASVLGSRLKCLFSAASYTGGVATDTTGNGGLLGNTTSTARPSTATTPAGNACFSYDGGDALRSDYGAENTVDPLAALPAIGTGQRMFFFVCKLTWTSGTGTYIFTGPTTSVSIGGFGSGTFYVDKTAGGYASSTSTDPIADGSWHRGMIVVDEATPVTKMYVDGVLQANTLAYAQGDPSEWGAYGIALGDTSVGLFDQFGFAYTATSFSGADLTALDAALLEYIGQAPVVFGSSGAAAAGTTALSVPYPTPCNAGDLLVLSITCKEGGTATPTTPSGWTLQGQVTGGAGTAGADSGSITQTVFTKEAAGTESGNLAVAFTSATATLGRIFRYVKKSGYTWDLSATTGSDNTAGTGFSAAGAANIGGIADDIYFVGAGVNTDARTFSLEAVTATGVTFGAAVERQDSATANGNDLAMVCSEHPVTAGPASAAPTFVMTASGTTANQGAGAAVILRMRAAAPAASTPYTLGVFPDLMLGRVLAHASRVGLFDTAQQITPPVAPPLNFAEWPDLPTVRPSTHAVRQLTADEPLPVPATPFAPWGQTVYVDKPVARAAAHPSRFESSRLTAPPALVPVVLAELPDSGPARAAFAADDQQAVGLLSPPDRVPVGFTSFPEALLARLGLHPARQVSVAAQQPQAQAVPPQGLAAFPDRFAPASRQMTAPALVGPPAFVPVDLAVLPDVAPTRAALAPAEQHAAGLLSPPAFVPLDLACLPDISPTRRALYPTQQQAGALLGPLDVVPIDLAILPDVGPARPPTGARAAGVAITPTQVAPVLSPLAPSVFPDETALPNVLHPSRQAHAAHQKPPDLVPLALAVLPERRRRAIPHASQLLSVVAQQPIAAAAAPVFLAVFVDQTDPLPGVHAARHGAAITPQQPAVVPYAIASWPVAEGPRPSLHSARVPVAVLPLLVIAPITKATFPDRFEPRRSVPTSPAMPPVIASPLFTNDLAEFPIAPTTRASAPVGGHQVSPLLVDPGAALALGLPVFPDRTGAAPGLHPSRLPAVERGSPFFTVVVTTSAWIGWSSRPATQIVVRIKPSTNISTSVRAVTRITTSARPATNITTSVRAVTRITVRSPAMSTLHVDDTAELPTEFRLSKTNALVDPSSVTARVTSPSGNVTVYVYGVGTNIVRDAEGKYRLLVDCTEAGQWRGAWVLPGPTAKGAEPFRFDVDPL